MNLSKKQLLEMELQQYLEKKHDYEREIAKLIRMTPVELKSLMDSARFYDRRGLMSDSYTKDYLLRELNGRLNAHGQKEEWLRARIASCHE